MRAMITELTEKQKEMIPVYVEKWAKIGLSCEPVTDYEETINLFYEKILNKKRPAKIILSPSPLSAWQQVLKLGKQLVVEQVVKQVVEQIKQQIREQLWEQLWQKLWPQVGSQVEQKVWRPQLKQQLWPQVWQQVGGFVYPYAGVQFSEVNFLVYDYFNEVLDIQFPKIWFIYKRIAELGLFYPFDDICIVLGRPEQISMKNKVLHNETGMAVKYRDGWGIYMLNGVRVTKEIVETPAAQLDPEIILKEENAEVRREIVRKIGVERLEKKLKPRVLDKWGDYELHDYSEHFKNMRCKPIYLKMKNPSIGAWHYEGVNIREMSAPTCQAALEWRLKGKDFNPKQIT